MEAARADSSHHLCFAGSDVLWLHASRNRAPGELNPTVFNWKWKLNYLWVDECVCVCVCVCVRSTQRLLYQNFSWSCLPCFPLNLYFACIFLLAATTFYIKKKRYLFVAMLASLLCSKFLEGRIHTWKLPSPIVTQVASASPVEGAQKTLDTGMNEWKDPWASPASSKCFWSQKHCVQWKKPVTKDHISYIFMKCPI